MRRQRKREGAEPWRRAGDRRARFVSFPPGVTRRPTSSAAFAAVIRAPGTPRSKGLPVSTRESSCRQASDLLRAIMNAAVEAELIEVNPVQVASSRVRSEIGTLGERVAAMTRARCESLRVVGFRDGRVPALPRDPTIATWAMIASRLPPVAPQALGHVLGHDGERRRPPFLGWRDRARARVGRGGDGDGVTTPGNATSSGAPGGRQPGPPRAALCAAGRCVPDGRGRVLT